MRLIASILKVSLVLAVLAVCVLPANADQIFVCQSCSTPPGGDPNIITNTGSFNVGLAGSGSSANPTLIVVAVYDGSGTPTVSFNGNPSVPLATVGTYGLTANTLANFTSGTAFGALGLTAGGSESFVNFSGADVAKGFAAPTSFTLFAFAVPTGLTGGSPITIDESGAAAGSFILGYGCSTLTQTACAHGDVSQTVFTNTGLLGGHPPSVPEPSTGLLSLLAVVGLAGLSFLRKF